ncbi:hypothetical protein WMY93_014093 [Mugilogobius chulae]|uniref:Putative nuclease HARBI1 n=1 Tax=Mugilogobius chulae TaxID=88201 RepID=A0AAW0NW10_9GOBI
MRRFILASLASRRNGRTSLYCLLNQRVPLLTLYFDGHSDLRPDFRLTRNTIRNLLGQLSIPNRQGWAHDVETLVFLFWLASGTSYRVVARAFDMPRSTVCDVVHRITDSILHLRHRVIRLPSDDDLPEVAAGFQQLAGSAAFNKVVGSIDGCHVRIKPPSVNAQCYFNRKLFHSIQLQAVCDHSAKFIDILVGYPGSVHDSRVLKNSPLYTQRLYPPHGYVMIGDGGYPCLSQPITLLTPYREPVRSPVEARFNRHHAKARSVIERAFGIMKARWRAIFFKALEVKPTFAVKVIACCTILHNICLHNRDILDPVEEEQGPADVQNQQEQQNGEHLRAAIAAVLSAPRIRAPHLQDHDY